MKTDPGGKHNLARLIGPLALGALIGMVAQADTYTDDFNRANVSATPTVGPGWLSATNATAPAYQDLWTLNSGVLYQGQAGASSLFYTNATLVGKQVYSISVDCRPALLAGNITIFANRPYMATAPYVAGLFQPGNKRIMLRVMEPDGTLRDHGIATDTDIADLQWYTFGLERSNEFARLTLTNANVALDTGWVSSFVRTVPYAGYASFSLDQYHRVDNFRLDLPAYTPAKDACFYDDFNRPYGTALTRLGPGWLSGTNTTGPAYLDKWMVNNAAGRPELANESAYATNVLLTGPFYSVTVRMYVPSSPLTGLFSIFGNKTYMGSSDGINASCSESLKRLHLQVVAGGTIVHNTYTYCAGFTVGQWYTVTLARSNQAARATVVGLNVDMDSGWQTEGIASVPRDGYSGIAIGSSNGSYFDDFGVFQPYVLKGTVISLK